MMEELSQPTREVVVILATKVAVPLPYDMRDIIETAQAAIADERHLLQVTFDHPGRDHNEPMILWDKVPRADRPLQRDEKPPRRHRWARRRKVAA